MVAFALFEVSKYFWHINSILFFFIFAPDVNDILSENDTVGQIVHCIMKNEGTCPADRDSSPCSNTRCLAACRVPVHPVNLLGPPWWWVNVWTKVPLKSVLTGLWVESNMWFLSAEVVVKVYIDFIAPELPELWNLCCFRWPNLAVGISVSVFDHCDAFQCSMDTSGFKMKTVSFFQFEKKRSKFCWIVCWWFVRNSNHVTSRPRPLMPRSTTST